MAEWALSATLFAFSILLLDPGDSFNTSPGYRLLSHYVSESSWGHFAGIIASAWLVALTINGTFRSSRRWSPFIRAGCAILAGGFWATNAAVIGATTPRSPGVVNNAGFAVLALALAANAAREMGVVVGKELRCPPNRRP